MQLPYTGPKSTGMSRREYENGGGFAGITMALKGAQGEFRSNRDCGSRGVV